MPTVVPYIQGKAYKAPLNYDSWAIFWFRQRRHASSSSHLGVALKRNLHGTRKTTALGVTLNGYCAKTAFPRLVFQLLPK